MRNIIDEILNFKSVSVVGLAKNTGKTETLNFILQRLSDSGKTVAVTSIGLDGEQIDQVFGTQKPEITVYKGMIFNTVEKFFTRRGIFLRGSGQTAFRCVFSRLRGRLRFRAAEACACPKTLQFPCRR